MYDQWENEGGYVSMHGGYKDEKPCSEYWGNVCSGFGGSLTCHRCGWERHEHHDPYLSEILERLEYQPKHRKD